MTKLSVQWDLPNYQKFALANFGTVTNLYQYCMTALGLVQNGQMRCHLAQLIHLSWLLIINDLLEEIDFLAFFQNTLNTSASPLALWLVTIQIHVGVKATEEYIRRKNVEIGSARGSLHESTANVVRLCRGSEKNYWADITAAFRRESKTECECFLTIIITELCDQKYSLAR